eukprot:TRINITY_DN1962_c1_g1_i1.p1 TRINITY_DN1962_c1_g1~~TRINITY_DN1962_c1_g1_i1.p1  ORF type:complete len:144 (+),score=14.44 TRINITY_DN1962_c1_g1_i1:83-514(+)
MTKAAIQPYRMNNTRRLMVGCGVMNKLKGLVFSDHLSIIAGFLGEEDERDRHVLSEGAVRVMEWINGKEASWVTRGMLSELTRSSSPSEGGLSSSVSSGSCDSPYESGIKPYQSVKPRCPLSSLSRAPKPRQPQNRTNLLIHK